LNGVLDKLASTVVHTLDQVVPQLEKMQSLLSHRGADRKKILRQAGLPGWTPWAKAYASKLDRSFRTIQDRIKRFRGPQASGAADTTGKAKSKGNGKRLRLDSRQQAALVRAQVAASDLVAALKKGADWQTALAEYDKVAVAPAKLDSFLNALSPEPDWKGGAGEAGRDAGAVRGRAAHSCYGRTAHRAEAARSQDRPAAAALWQADGCRRRAEPCAEGQKGGQRPLRRSGGRSAGRGCLESASAREGNGIPASPGSSWSDKPGHPAACCCASPEAQGRQELGAHIVAQGHNLPACP
jgi:hypothetical protein